METIEIPHEIYLRLLRRATPFQRQLSEKLRVSIIATQLLDRELEETRNALGN